MTQPGIVAVVEAQHSSSGIRPLAVLRELGRRPVFVSNDPDRYADLPAADLLHAGGVEVLTADTNTVDGLRAALAPLARNGRPQGVHTNVPVYFGLMFYGLVAQYAYLRVLDPGRHRALADRLG